MSLRPEQLSGQLTKGLAQDYNLSGAEPLLLQECRDEVIHAAQSAGFAERSVHEVSGKIDWNQLDVESAGPSLFDSKIFLDIRSPPGKPGK